MKNVIRLIVWIGGRVKMTDSFMHNHQSALDSFMEDKAIQDLEDAGIYPVPDNDAIMEDIYEDVLANHPEMSGVNQVRLAEEIFRDLPEPLDNS